jgi:hypothetical protein
MKKRINKINIYLFIYIYKCCLPNHMKIKKAALGNNECNRIFVAVDIQCGICVNDAANNDCDCEANLQIGYDVLS